MQLEEITLALFAACNSVRVLAYVPQIHKAAMDENGASAISRTTWSLFLVAHVSTIAYALVNRSDPWLALCFAGNALCCVVILAIAWWKEPVGRITGARPGFNSIPRNARAVPARKARRSAGARRVSRLLTRGPLAMKDVTGFRGAYRKLDRFRHGLTVLACRKFTTASSQRRDAINIKGIRNRGAL